MCVALSRRRAVLSKRRLLLFSHNHPYSSVLTVCQSVLSSSQVAGATEWPIMAGCIVAPRDAQVSLTLSIERSFLINMLTRILVRSSVEGDHLGYSVGQWSAPPGASYGRALGSLAMEC